MFSSVQKEHSSILSNLRATTEPLFTVTEMFSGGGDAREEHKDEALSRTRKKGHVELRNPVVQPPSAVQVGRVESLEEIRIRIFRFTKIFYF